MSKIPLRPARTHWACLFLIVTALLLAPAASSAQGGDFHVRIGNSVAVLTGPWKFHPGDDPAWSSPGFDDAQWGRMDLTPPAGSTIR